jgi:phospholipid transport system substrate-binding protein
MRALSLHQPKSAGQLDRRSRLLRSVAAGLVLGVTIVAGGPVARAAGASDPTVSIQRLDAALLAAMKAGHNAPFTQRYALLSSAVEQAFDLNAVLRAAVGLSWDSLSADQKAALAGAFERYTVSNYAANFDSYDGQTFRVLPETRPLPNGAVVVRTQIIRRNNAPVEFDYIMRQTGESWKAVDVLTNGTISQVAVQRSDFRGLLDNGGAPALRAGLERKAATLSAGAMT